MSTFTAEGKLSLPETGREIASVSCTIFLRKPTESERGEWYGTLIVTAGRREFQRAYFQQGEGEFVLKLNDGREGRIIITNVPVTPEGIGAVSFLGSGSLK